MEKCNNVLTHLIQLFRGGMWDSAIDDIARKALLHRGLSENCKGYNIITVKGVQILIDLGYVQA